MVGLTTGYDRVVLRGDPGAERRSPRSATGRQARRHRVRQFAPAITCSARRLLVAACSITAEQAADQHFDLKKRWVDDRGDLRLPSGIDGAAPFSASQIDSATLA